MIKKSYQNFSKFIALTAVVALTACSGLNSKDDSEQVIAPMATPTVDYVESLDVYSAPHKDSFLNQLAMNYRSYAVYNARTSGYSEIGEIFAQKSVSAFSGETPFPESLENWPIQDENLSFELHTACNKLLDELRNDAADNYPELAAEAQAKFDCWLSSTASGQIATANECKSRFESAMTALKNGGKVISKKEVKQETSTKMVRKSSEEAYYPETGSFSAMKGNNRARDGVIIVNNVNIPEHLINPVPVAAPAQPMIFNQNIYGGDRTVTTCNDGNCDKTDAPAAVNNQEIPELGDQVVSRDEFINMMMAMRSELAAINERLDRIESKQGEKTVLKVQQIPLEPKQHVMEEIFEVRFDFNKATIKPEYADLIRKLATATQENKNIKVTVIGHTDTMGNSNYNYALGGRRADTVSKMLVKYGIPAAQIVSVSAGEEDNKVQTGDNVANADNRRVQVTKEVHFTEPGRTITPQVEVEEYTTRPDCEGDDCENYIQE